MNNTVYLFPSLLRGRVSFWFISGERPVRDKANNFFPSVERHSKLRAGWSTSIAALCSTWCANAERNTTY